MHNRKLGRTADHRKALLRNLATEVVMRGKIETTEKKAMELRNVVDSLITVAKKDTLAARRQAAAYLYKDEAVKKLFAEIAPKYAYRKSGYTRVTKTGIRKGDNAPLATIEIL